MYRHANINRKLELDLPKKHVGRFRNPARKLFWIFFQKEISKIMLDFSASFWMKRVQFLQVERPLQYQFQMLHTINYLFFWFLKWSMSIPSKIYCLRKGIKKIFKKKEKKNFQEENFFWKNVKKKILEKKYLNKRDF